MIPIRDFFLRAAGLLLLAALPACTDSREFVESKFLRFVEKSEYTGRLETAIVSYKNEDGIRVDLVAAVHLGDPGYFRTLQDRFTAYDALLYELVAEEGVVPSGDKAEDSLLSLFQRMLCKTMELDFQLDAIDYEQPNFVHADLTVTEFRKLWREKGESIWKIILRILTASAQAQRDGKASQMTMPALMEALMSDDRAGRLKLLLAKEFENIEYLMAGLESGKEGEESVLMGERNKAAIRTLEEEIDKGKKSLAIFYGGGHMQDLELRLQRDLAFHRTDQEWVVAWEIGGE